MQNIGWTCQKHQGQKPRKSARGGGVLGPTRGKNPAKLPVVMICKSGEICKKPHKEYLTK